MESLQILTIAVMIVVPVLTLFVIGRLSESRDDRRPMRTLSARGAWSTVVRGNTLLAPSFPRVS